LETTGGFTMSSEDRRTSRIEDRIAANSQEESAHWIRLSVDDQRLLVDLLLNPPAVSASLKRAREAHERLIGDS
jgi:hypothetical protein